MKNKWITDSDIKPEILFTESVFRTYASGHEVVFDRTITKNQQEAINKRKKHKKKKAKMQSLLAVYDINRYVYIYHLDVELSKSDLARLIFLSSYAGYNEGFLVYDNGAPIKEKDLASVLLTSQITTNRFKKNLKKLGILTFDNGMVYISTDFVFKGKRTNEKKDFSRMFNNSIRDLYMNSNPSSLALLYKILPYISFWHNVLCKNPKSKKDKPIEPLNWNDLCRILNIKNPSELKKKLKEFNFSNDEPILKTGTIGEKKLIYVNPRIVFKNNDSESFELAYSTFLIGEKHQSIDFSSYYNSELPTSL